ncbi:heme ABC transporter substrate-binding protein IsdE [Paenibacillus sp. L3-i20]|uniref:heme ABC transporter substrate-binding protein IsdE n=1 Tax=Paenibacillus sp. L3-i20 TaxID=2905833 RepID=UPI001EDF01AC|nr:heme ABC transporter substrate-binding protein IsdE [Paenibacillus sp. L3-i20]GKU76754.1 heme ABC transporter substrate-binding protein IsdE [Paenibacillus sp. L3-i20]
MFGTKLRFIALMTLIMVSITGCGNSGANKGTPGVEKSAVASTKTVESTKTSSPTAEEPRVVSTTVAITQIMDLLEIDLVGIPKSVKTLPTRYDGLTKVGSPMSPDMELVKSLRPTEVLSVTTLQYDLEPVFENAKIAATFLDFTSLEKMQAEIIKLGEKFGKQEKAAQIVNEYDETLKEIRKATEGKQPPTVLILLGVPGSYLVATEHSYVGDLVELLGGVNIVQGEKVEFLASNTEYLQQSDPDVILRLAHGMPKEVVEMFDEEFKKNDIWHHFKAVKTGRVYDLEEKLFGTTGNIEVGGALEALLPLLYPESS